jgi:hypothetical protein
MAERRGVTCFRGFWRSVFCFSYCFRCGSKSKVLGLQECVYSTVIIKKKQVSNIPRSLLVLSWKPEHVELCVAMCGYVWLCGRI